MLILLSNITCLYLMLKTKYKKSSDSSLHLNMTASSEGLQLILFFLCLRHLFKIRVTEPFSNSSCLRSPINSQINTLKWQSLSHSHTSHMRSTMNSQFKGPPTSCALVVWLLYWFSYLFSRWVSNSRWWLMDGHTTRWRWLSEHAKYSAPIGLASSTCELQSAASLRHTYHVVPISSLV